MENEKKVIQKRINSKTKKIKKQETNQKTKINQKIQKPDSKRYKVYIAKSLNSHKKTENGELKNIII